jgi:peptidoglycan L-alanyl-D-glutamate endopeptidase CwlK
MNKVLILSLAPIGKWKTLKKKIDYITKSLNKAKNAEFVVDIVELSAVAHVPEVKQGRITHAYMDKLTRPYFDTGYDFVALHMSKAQWKSLGIQTSLLGSYHVDNDECAEIYFWADENTTLAKHGYRDKFGETFLHEMGHAYAQGAELPDDTHEYHNRTKDMSNYYKSKDMSLYQKERMLKRRTVTLLQKLKASLLLLKPTKLQPLVELRANAIVDAMALMGHPVRIVEGFRSIERQNQLYAQGRTAAGQIVTNAKGGESFHNYGVAVDFVFRNEGYNASKELWNTLGAVGKSQGFEWGGDWKGFVDLPHFELKQGYTLKDFQEGKVDYSKFK